MTLTEVVVDASVVVRGLTRDGSAADVFDRIASGTTKADAPDLIVAEISNALVLAVRAGRLRLDGAQAAVRATLSSPIDLHPTTALAPAAVEVAAATGLSAYDAFYAVLAAALRKPLVTTDRRLAEVVPGAMLLT